MTALNLLGAPPVDTRARQRFVWAGLAALAMALCVVHGTQSRGLARLSAEVESLRSNAADLSKRLDAAQRRARANSELRARLGLIDRLGRNRGRARKLLTGVGDAVAQSMWLTELSYSKDGVSVSGVAGTPEQVTAFLSQLSGSGAFTSVDVLDLKRDDSQFHFTLQGRLAGDAGDDDKARGGESAASGSEA